MKYFISGLIVAVLIVIAAFFYGKQVGSSKLRSTVVQNQTVIRKIAELASLEVQGNQKVTISNADRDEGMWASFKNYFWENTLQVTVPFTAKYGVVMQGRDCTINQEDSVIVISLPECKLLSLELKMDQVETMNQRGVFAGATLEDLKRAQGVLYQKTSEQLKTDTGLIRRAQLHIEEILGDYYQPLGYTVRCEYK